MTPVETIPIQPWMSDPATRSVMAAISIADSDGPTALFVGGCVRDALLGREVGDVDIATVHAPDAVMGLLDAAGIGYHTIGADHGTVAAHVDGRVFEITTLRVDVETDGRRAKVAFTDDWNLDASRRDFTMNALYANAEGHVFDPLGGMGDLKARRVRFIGDPNERIQEDALRILRFFRFHAQLDIGVFDRDGLTACMNHAGMVNDLSGERVCAEIQKLLTSGDPVASLRAMFEAKILSVALPQLQNIDGLAALVRLDDQDDRDDSSVFVRRLVSMIVNETAAREIAGRLRLSRAEAGRLVSLLVRATEIGPELTIVERRTYLYRVGELSWRDTVLLNWAMEITTGLALDDDRMTAWREVLHAPESYPMPEFSLRGADVLDLGVPQGLEVSRLLDAVEAWWIDGGFDADRAACLNELRRRIDS